MWLKQAWLVRNLLCGTQATLQILKWSTFKNTNKMDCLWPSPCKRSAWQILTTKEPIRLLRFTSTLSYHIINNCSLIPDIITGMSNNSWILARFFFTKTQCFSHEEWSGYVVKDVWCQVTVDLQWCLPKNHSYARHLYYNHRKVYIIVKLIMYRIRRNNFFKDLI